MAATTNTSMSVNARRRGRSLIAGSPSACGLKPAWDRLPAGRGSGFQDALESTSHSTFRPRPALVSRRGGIYGLQPGGGWSASKGIDGPVAQAAKAA
ncbi:MAG: hypothetical protein AMXMBFR83_10120 [Phycisphaerae bacterium]